MVIGITGLLLLLVATTGALFANRAQAYHDVTCRMPAGNFVCISSIVALARSTFHSITNMTSVRCSIPAIPTHLKTHWLSHQNSSCTYVPTSCEKDAPLFCPAPQDGIHYRRRKVFRGLLFDSEPSNHPPIMPYHVASYCDKSLSSI